MPRFSVIIPVYNVEKYLDRCVRSVTGQTFKDLDIILVDDGSPDHCPAMCDEWAEKDSRIRVIIKKTAASDLHATAVLRLSQENIFHLLIPMTPLRRICLNGLIQSLPPNQQISVILAGTGS